MVTRTPDDLPLLTTLTGNCILIVQDDTQPGGSKTRRTIIDALANYVGTNLSGITIAQVSGLQSALANLQPLNAELTNLSAQSSLGIVARTGTATYSELSLVAPAAGLTIANPAGTAGNPTFALANDLAALEGLAATGIAVRTATDTWAQRAVTGTANQITVTNGDGVAGNPTISLPSAITLTGITLTGGTFNSPALVTPALGTPASGIATNLTGTAAGLTAGNVTTNANLTGDVTSVGNATTLTNAPVIAKVLTGYVSGAGTISASDSILSAIQKLNGNNATNANLTGVITSVGNATSIASQTGTGTKFVVDTSPTIITPILGVAAATSINKVAITAPATGSTLTIADGKTLTASNSLTLAGADGSSIAFGAGGTVAYTANNLSVFAATTSAQLAGVISDETGTGALVFGTAPTITGGLVTALTSFGLRSTGATFDLKLASSEALTANHTLSVVLGNADRTLTFTGNASITGTNTGDQTITLTGDVTGSGAGSFASTISNNAVTYAKFQQVAASSLVGNATGTLANATAITLGSTLAFSGSALQTGAGTGDVSWSANSFATSIGAAKVTNVHVNTSVITGQTLNNSPVPANDYVLYYSASASAFQKATISSIISSGASGVSTFNGRSGTVVPTSGDYTVSQITGAAPAASPVFSGTITGTYTLGGTPSIAGSAVNSGLVGATFGGTGANNGSNTITLAGNVSHAGAFTQTFTATANTSVTLPTSGTLATTANINTALPSATTSQLYGGTAAAGAAQAVTLGSGLSLSGGTLSATSAGASWSTFTSVSTPGGTQFVTLSTSLTSEEIYIYLNGVPISQTDQINVSLSTNGGSTWINLGVGSSTGSTGTALYGVIILTGLKSGRVSTVTAFQINNAAPSNASVAYQPGYWNMGAQVNAVRVGAGAGTTMSSSTGLLAYATR